MNNQQQHKHIVKILTQFCKTFIKEEKAFVWYGVETLNLSNFLSFHFYFRCFCCSCFQNDGRKKRNYVLFFAILKLCTAATQKKEETWKHPKSHHYNPTMTLIDSLNCLFFQLFLCVFSLGRDMHDSQTIVTETIIVEAMRQETIN